MMVDSWQEKHRIQMRSFMHHAVDLCTRIGLPGDRMPLRGVGLPLDQSPYLPEVRMHMIDPTVGRNSSLAERLATALETLHTYSDCIQCYTDGSASDETALGGRRRSGYGVLVLYQHGANLRREELLGPCGSICNYEAEMEAISVAIRAVRTRLDDGSAARTDVVLFIDALSILQAINGMGEWPWRLK